MVTCSGNFSTPAFLCTVAALGIDNVMFSVDWPYELNVAAVEFLKRVPLGPSDLAKVASGNAERVLRLYRLGACAHHEATELPTFVASGSGPMGRQETFGAKVPGNLNLHVKLGASLTRVQGYRAI